MHFVDPSTWWYEPYWNHGEHFLIFPIVTRAWSLKAKFLLIFNILSMFSMTVLAFRFDHFWRGKPMGLFSAGWLIMTWSRSPSSSRAFVNTSWNIPCICVKSVSAFDISIHWWISFYISFLLPRFLQMSSPLF